MRNSLFLHLHAHTEYSLLDGCGTAKSYCQKAKALGFEGIAITDHGNLDGAIRFQKEASENDLIPIIGCEAYIVPDAQTKNKKEDRGHVILLVKNEEGFHNLLKMMSYANLTGFYKRPRIDYKTLLNSCSGLIVSTACIASFINLDGGIDLLNDLHDKLQDDLYLEIMPHDLERQKTLNKLCAELSEKKGISLIATNDCHYVNEDDWEAQKALLGIQYDLRWNDPKLDSYVLKGIYLKSADEMEDAFDRQKTLSYRTYISAMRETKSVLEKCKDFRIEKHDIRLPVIPGYEKKDDYVIIKNKCFDSKRFNDTPEYIDRLNEELELIEEKNFSRYFLLVSDWLDRCREKKIMIGPGRGSVGGSLMAYYLGITSLDPIKHGLLFSRFINKDRIDYPDIDIDLDSQKRDLAKKILEELYGENNIASVGTFSRLKNRSVIRDIGRAFDLPAKDVDIFAKSLANEDDLEQVFVDTIEGKEFYRKYSKPSELAVKLRGMIRGRGQHAAAIIISPDDLREGRRTYLLDKDGSLVINWDMEDAEYMGLLKIDALYLDMMAVMDEANTLIEKNHGTRIDFEQIPLEDPEILKEINDGKTVGCFQINTRPMTQLIQEMEVSNFRHVSDAMALVRPGPFNSGMTSEYIKRKHGKKWEKMPLLYEKATELTYGVVTYQEQVMEIINKVAGLDYSIADKIRKVIGKKRNVEEFKPFHDMFVEGCLKQETMTKEQADEFWNGLKEHSHYSFNLSHSVAYSIVAIQTAWLKHYYPTEFVCASLTYSKSETPKLVNEAKRLGLKVIPPKFGISDAFKWIAKDNNLYVPFVEVKGIGPKMAVEATGKITKTETKNKGFYVPSKKNVITGKLGTILSAIDAYNKESIPDNIDEYLPDVDLSVDLSGKYPKLVDTIGNSWSVEEGLEGDITIRNQAHKISKRKALTGLKSCKACQMRKKANQVVLPSWGQYNIMAIGEGPGPDEDKKGEGFVGKAGDTLWKELLKYKIRRAMLYVTNAEHCFPGSGKDKNEKEVLACTDICARKWLDNEIENVGAKICLVMGNIARYALTGINSGIQSVSGNTEWLEEYGMWACWCVHPSSVLRSLGQNKSLFEKGIKNFSNVVERIGGI